MNIEIGPDHRLRKTLAGLYVQEGKEQGRAMFVKKATESSYQVICFFEAKQGKGVWKLAPNRSGGEEWARCNDWVSRGPPERAAY